MRGEAILSGLPLHHAPNEVYETHGKGIPEHNVECQSERLKVGGVHHLTAFREKGSITLVIECPREADDRAALEADAAMKE